MDFKKNIAFKIALFFLTLTAFFTLFRSSMAGIFSLFYSKAGISDAEISSIKSFQNIGILIGLLPSGYLSDKIGRLKVLVFSSLVISFSFLLLLLFKNHISFSCAEFIYGIGLALNSGTLLSYITELQENYNLSPNKKLMSYQVIILNLTTLIGGNIGTWLFSYKITLPIYFAMIGLLIYPVLTILLAKSMKFSDNKKNTKNNDTFESKIITFKHGINFVQKKDFWILLLLNVGFDCGTQFLLIYWPIIYVDNLKFDLSFVYTLFMVSNILGSTIFNKLSSILTSKGLVLFNTCSMVILFISSGLIVNRYLQLISFLFIELLMGIISGQITAESNEAIYGEKSKSFMLSTVSFLTEIIVSLSLLLNDKIIQETKNIKIMFFVSALYFLILLFILPMVKKNDRYLYSKS